MPFLIILCLINKNISDSLIIKKFFKVRIANSKYDKISLFQKEGGKEEFICLS